MLSTQLQDLNRRLGKSGLWRLAVLFPITLSWWWSCCCTQKGSGISMSESSFQVTVWTILCLYQEMGSLFVFSKEVLWNFHQQNYSGKCLLSLGFLERSNERTQLQLNILCYLKKGQYSFASMRWVQSVCFMLCLQHQQPLSETYCKDFSLNYQLLANHWPLLWVSNLILSSLQTSLHQITIVQCLLQVVWHFPHSRGDLKVLPSPSARRWLKHCSLTGSCILPGCHSLQPPVGARWRHLKSALWTMPVFSFSFVSWT